MAKGKKRSEQTYQHKQNAINITLYDVTGETIDPTAKQEFEDAALTIAQKHPNTLLSIATT